LSYRDDPAGQVDRDEAVPDLLQRARRRSARRAGDQHAAKRRRRRQAARTGRARQELRRASG
jgi:hypothetical protein